MDFLDKIENIIIKIEKTMIVTFGSIMMISVFLQVFFRYVVRTSVPWTEEISIISFIMMFFYGASFASYQKRHLGINNFVNKLPETSYKIIWFIKNIIILLFLINIIVICSFPMVIRGLEQVSVITRIPRFYIFIQIPILGLLFFFHLMMSFLRKDYLEEFSLIKKKEV